MTTQSWLPDTPVRLSGAGLVLREWAEPDLQEMIALFDEESIDRWTPLESPFDLTAARRYLARAAQRRRQRTALQLAITVGGGTPLGEVLLFDHGGRAAELGYSVGLTHRGRGLAVRAVQLLIEQAADEWGFREFTLRIEASNGDSERVAAACGFSRSKQPPVRVESKGRPVDLGVWRCLADPSGTPGHGSGAGGVKVMPDPSCGVTPLNSPRAGRQQG